MPTAQGFYGGQAPDDGPGTRHPRYKALADVRQTVRDADSGQEAILKAASRYVPQPAGMESGEYLAYVRRAAYYAAVERTTDAAVGVAFRREPDVITQVEDDVEDVDLKGNDIAGFARLLFRELVLMGSATVVVDIDDVTNRPYWRIYRAEDVFSWRNDGPRLGAAVVHDVGYTQNGFVYEEQHRLVSYNVEENVATAQKYNLISGKWENDGPPIVLQQLGEEMDRLPVRISTIAGGKPPMRGVANLAAAHFRLSCDHMHALHWSALPTPWVTGATSSTPLKIGGSEAWQLPADATVGFLEFTGAGTGQMLEMIQHYETQMAAIGARLLARPAAGAEAAETVRLKSLADTSLLVLASVECSNVLTWALKMHEALAGRPSDDTDVSLDRNFHTANLTAQDLAAIVKAWQDGALSC